MLKNFIVDVNCVIAINISDLKQEIVLTHQVQPLGVGVLSVRLIKSSVELGT